MNAANGWVVAAKYIGSSDLANSSPPPSAARIPPPKKPKHLLSAEPPPPESLAPDCRPQWRPAGRRG